MTEKQIDQAMNLLARLYADQIGMINPIIERRTKDDKCNKKTVHDN